MCTEATNLAKQVTDVIGNLAIITRKTGPQQQTTRSRPNEKYFNYSKKGYYTRDYPSRNNLKRKSEDKKMKQKAKHAR